MTLQEMYAQHTKNGLSEAYYLYELITKPRIEKLNILREHWTIINS